MERARRSFGRNRTLDWTPTAGRRLLAAVPPFFVPWATGCTFCHVGRKTDLAGRWGGERGVPSGGGRERDTIRQNHRCNTIENLAFVADAAVTFGVEALGGPVGGVWRLCIACLGNGDAGVPVGGCSRFGWKERSFTNRGLRRQVVSPRAFGAFDCRQRADSSGAVRGNSGHRWPSGRRGFRNRSTWASHRLV